MSRATIADVARIAKVSKSTVSRVLSGNTVYMRDETRERVLSAVAALNYRPSGIARSLVSKRTHTVGLLISDVGNPFYSDVIHGAEDVAIAHGYGLFLCNTNYDVQRGWAYIQSLIDKQVDGVLIASSSMSDEWLLELARHQIPAVVVDWNVRHVVSSALHIITQDFETGIQEAVNHLLGLGHRRLAHVSGPLELETSRIRRDAFLKALAMHGIDPAQVQVVEGNLRTDGGRHAMAQLLALPTRPTAVFAANDLTAIGIIWAVRDCGLRVPEDLSVVGLDNIQLAAEITPALTTVALQRYELGDMCMQMLLDLRSKACPEMSRSEMVSHLVVRQSTAPPSAKDMNSTNATY
ncbi:MAG: LacI family DNA-binding transcriptional regulator [Thermoflexales bacterium]|nr:LacI family DNA-binding transcriptional regulator [Thermoflexales bacterium]